MCGLDGKKTVLTINGFSVEAVYTKGEIELIDRMIDRLSSIYNKGKSAVAFLAGPPGSGKSTLAEMIVKRAGDRKLPVRLSALGLDGFHRKQKVLENTTALIDGRFVRLSEIKGRPETFDHALFLETVEKLKTGGKVVWPVYDRNLHDVSPSGICPRGDVFIIEGNWLLFESDAWKRAGNFCDYSISVDAGEDELRERLVQRKMRGGKSREEAERWFETVDGPNISLYTKNLRKADLRLELKGGILKQKESV